MRATAGQGDYADRERPGAEDRHHPTSVAVPSIGYNRWSQPGREPMAHILFRNCHVWDGSGAPSYPADVLVEGDRVRAVATHRGQLEAGGAEVIEANGMTLMPGLVEGHAHITFING